MFHSGGILYLAFVEIGHVSFSEMWSMCFCSASSVPTLLLTFIASGFNEHLNIGKASGFLQHSSMGMLGTEATTNLSSFA